ncbi:hypothetical protein EE612_046131, partial [Oryza sativa]
VQCLFQFPPPTSSTPSALARAVGPRPLTAVNLRRFRRPRCRLRRGGASAGVLLSLHRAMGKTAPRSCSRRLRNDARAAKQHRELLRRRTSRRRGPRAPSSLYPHAAVFHPPLFPSVPSASSRHQLHRYFASLPSIPQGTPHTPFYSD